MLRAAAKAGNDAQHFAQVGRRRRRRRNYERGVADKMKEKARRATPRDVDFILPWRRGSLSGAVTGTVFLRAAALIYTSLASDRTPSRDVCTDPPRGYI